MGKSTLDWLEGIAERTYALAGLDPRYPVAPGALTVALFATAPERVEDLPRESLMTWLDGVPRFMVRADVQPERARHCLAHEIAHALLDPTWFDTSDELEDACDMLGSCLLAPRPAFRRLVELHQHAVFDLAHALGCPQSMALLRIGEVDGRPVKLLSRRPRVRGRAFNWPDSHEAIRGLHRARVHPIRLSNEGRWGLMAAG